MPFSRPSLAQITARVKTDIQGALDGVAAFFKRSFERGAGNAMAAVSHQQHAHIDWVARQFDPNKADEDQLIRVHAAPFGVVQKQAVAAQFTITATGTDGVIIPTAWVYTRADGPRYTVNAPGSTVAGGVVTVTLTASVAGQLANSPAGTPIKLDSPIAGLNDDAVAVAVVADGSDIETKEELLQRVLLRRRTPPRGGAPGDYQRWMLEVAGITRAWEYPRREGAGTVTLYGVNDNGAPIIALSPAKLAEVETYLDQPGRQPSTVDVLVYTPTLQPVNLTISLRPNTVDVQNAVLVEIDEVFRRTGHPGGMTLLLSELNEAISIAPGETDHNLTVPADNVEVPFGSVPVRGGVTWFSL